MTEALETQVKSKVSIKVTPVFVQCKMLNFVYWESWVVVRMC